MNAPTLSNPVVRDRVERELAEIRRIVSEHYKIPRSELTSRARTEPLATIRQVAMFLSRTLTEAPLQTIACSFARTDHGTVAHAFEAIPDKMQTSPVLTTEVGILKNKCEAALAALK